MDWKNDWERSWIKKICEYQKQHNHSHASTDDVAMFPGENANWIVSTDALVDGVHFRTSWMNLKDLAYKSFVAASSDLVCKGSQPRFVLMTLGKPTSMNQDMTPFLDEFFSQLSKHDAFLLGGDTVSSNQLWISITVWGQAPKQSLLRSNIEAGQELWHCGSLGESSAGLYLLERGHRLGERGHFDQLISQHLRPTLRPYLAPILDIRAEGADVIHRSAIGASMDTSDALSTSFYLLCEDKEIQIEIEEEALTPTIALAQFCKEFNEDPISFILHGGEDYGILLSAEPSLSQALEDYNRQHHDEIWRRIGQVRAGAGLPHLIAKSGKRLPIEDRGYKHF